MILTIIHEPDFDVFDDDPDDEPGITSQKAAKKKGATFFDVTYKVYTPHDIEHQQEEMVNEVNMILESDLDLEYAWILNVPCGLLLRKDSGTLEVVA